MFTSQQEDIMIIKIMKRHPQGDAVSFKLGGRFVVVQFFVWFGFLVFLFVCFTTYRFFCIHYFISNVT